MLAMKLKRSTIGYFMALLSALIFSLSIPINTWFLSENIHPLYLSAFLYLGVGLGMSVHVLVQKESRKQPLTKNDRFAFVAMGLLDTFAPILFFSGMALLSGSTTGILANIEFVLTILFAFFIFKERFSWLSSVAMMLVVFSIVLLNVNPSSSFFQFRWGIGEWFIFLSSICWGLENNFSRMLSVGNPNRLLMVKGLSTYVGVQLITFFIPTSLPSWNQTILLIIVGYVIYGLSLQAYVLGQRYLGAGVTQSIQSFAFVLGSFLSFIIFQETLSSLYGISVGLIVVALLLFGYDNYRKKA
jgi:drug/metabolite transporter (DMT)-like permease